ncbi:MAG: hypothetical protein FJX42_07420 [Alphaproteobacteria bacterium]|nr:hypothetical protein [Alphaproteobacteria bacterium]
MTGPADILSGRSLAYGLASLGTMAARPNFELQFNILQNSIIERINREIEKVNENSTERIDAFLLSSQRKLDLFKVNIETFQFFNNRNAWAVPELKTKLDTLDAALSTIPSPDTAKFDAALSQINEIVGLLYSPNGYVVGISLDDGITALRRDGLINVTRNGEKIKVTSYSQFVDGVEAGNAISKARTQLDVIYNNVILKAESAEILHVMTAENLTSVSFQIEVTKTAAQAEKAQEMTKLRESYGRLLNSISLAFESNQALAEQMGRALFDPNHIDAGSAVNIIT